MDSSQARVLGDTSILPAMGTTFPPALLRLGFTHKKLTVTQTTTTKTATSPEVGRVAVFVESLCGLGFVPMQGYAASNQNQQQAQINRRGRLRHSRRNIQREVCIA